MSGLRFNNWNIFAFKSNNGIYSLDSGGYWKYPNGYGNGTGPYDDGSIMDGQKIVKILEYKNQAIFIGEHGRISSLDVNGVWTKYDGSSGIGFYNKGDNRFDTITDAVVFGNYLVLSTEEGEVFSHNGAAVWDPADPLHDWEYPSGTGFGEGPKNNKTALGFKKINCMTVINDTLVIAGDEGRVASYSSTNGWKNYDAVGNLIHNDGQLFNYEDIVSCITVNNIVWFLTKYGKIYQYNIITYSFISINDENPFDSTLATKFVYFNYVGLLVVCGEKGKIACFDPIQLKWNKSDGSGDGLGKYFNNGSMFEYSNLENIFIDSNKQVLYVLGENEKAALYDSWTDKWIYNCMYPPFNIQDVVATPLENYIDFKWDSTTSTKQWENSVGYYFGLEKYDINDNQILEFYTIKNNSFRYYFNRDEEGYPEIEKLATWSIKVKAFNSDGVISSSYHSNYLDGMFDTEDDYLVANYGTWDIDKIDNVESDFNVVGSGRNITATWEKPVAKTQPYNKKLNGEYYYNIKISIDNILYYAPTVTKNEYIDEESWKEESGYFQATAEGDWIEISQTIPNYYIQIKSELPADPVVGDIYQVLGEYRSIYGQRFSHSVPLAGQNDASPQPTTYYYKTQLISKQPTSTNISYEKQTDWCPSKNITAQPVSARDVVSAKLNDGQPHPDALTAENIYVKNLAAFNATLGVISSDEIKFGEGASTGSPWNYWILNTVSDIYGPDYNLGDMQIGNGDRGLKIKPTAIGSEDLIRIGNYDDSGSYISIQGNGDMNIKADLLDIDAERSTLDSPFVVNGSFTANGYFKNNIMWVDPDIPVEDDTKRFYDNTVKDEERKSILLSNSVSQDIRNNGLDVGKKLPEDGKVVHFDGSYKANDKFGTVCDILTPSGTINDNDDNFYKDDTAIQNENPFTNTRKCLETSYKLLSAAQSNITSNWYYDCWIKPMNVSTIGPDGIRLLTISTVDNGTGANIAELRIFSFKYEYESKTGSGSTYEYEATGPGQGNDKQYVEKSLASETIEARYRFNNGTAVSTIVDTAANLSEWNHLAIMHNTTNELYFVVNGEYYLETGFVSASPTSYYVNLNLDLKPMRIEEFLFCPTLSPTDITINYEDYVNDNIILNTDDKIPWAALDYKSRNFVLNAGNISNELEYIKMSSTSFTGNVKIKNVKIHADSVAPTGSDQINVDGYLKATKIYNAVYNDIVDCIEVGKDLEIEYGRVYVMDSNIVKKATKKCQKGCLGIASDTYGFALGEDENKNQMPLAIGGFVLAHTPIYESGTPLVSNKDGTLIKASIIDRLLFSHRIMATFYKEEKQAMWNEIKVNNRHWVKIS